ncbi:MAG: hypothetical protein GY810_14345 [Aureispira sp.]|nr:hypothetical protein [Aureispira sp.]
MRFIALGIFIIAHFNSTGQSLHEDNYIQFYLGRSIQRAQLAGESGLGKFILFKNMPAVWVTEYHQDNSLTSIDGLFGNVGVVQRELHRNNFLLDFRGNSLGELDANAFGHLEFNKISTQLSINGHWNNTKTDQNKDNFLDLPLKKRLLVQNQWAVNTKRYSSINRILYLGLDQTAGQTHFNKKIDRLSSNVYGMGDLVHHVVAESYNYITPRARDLLIIDLKLVDHNQKSFYGLREYNAKEWLTDLGAHYIYKLNKIDAFHFGLNYKYQNFRENFDTLQLVRKESVGGGYLGYETYFGKKVQLSTRINIHYHNLAKFFISPQVRLNWIITDFFRASLWAGNGMRYANILSENTHLLTSSRQITIKEPLRAEQAWHYGASFSFQEWIVDRLYCNIDLQFSQTHYLNKTILDLDYNPYSILFYNLDGIAQKTSIEIDARFRLDRPFIGLNLDYRMDWTASTINQIYAQEPLYSVHHVLLGVDYNLKIQRRWIVQFGLQYHYASPQRLPDISSKTNGSSYPFQTTAIHQLNMELTLPFFNWFRHQNKWTNFTFYFGLNNLLNQTQPLPAVAHEAPFSPNFDAGMQWNTTVGRRFYGGVRYLFR